MKVGFDRQQEAQVPVHDAPHNPSGAFMPNPAVAEFVPSLAALATKRKKRKKERSSDVDSSDVICSAANKLTYSS